MNATEYNVLELIPQRPPVVMIDCLAETRENYAKAKLTVKASNLFCLNGFLQEAGIIECMAQTAAAYTGYLCLTNHKDILPGFIAAIKYLFIYELPAVDTEIISEIFIENEVLGYVIVTGKVTQNTHMIAECEMRIFTLSKPDIN
jgi:predicted hotdog family 3-hydroxylacyl-ACP dehydratase